ncbi:MAG: hypothetical protein JSW23_04175 [Planctomycetota bacterium]|nr:MAG: hypothetical protein JSW23_04175 [Planctomycetota bacterium]
MKRILICLVIVVLASAALAAMRRDGGPTKLTVELVKAGEDTGRYRLLSSAEERVDEDAVGLYKEAVASLPEDMDLMKIGGWVRGPLDALPRKEAESTLEELKGTLESVERAAKCKRCDWPFAVVAKPEEQRGYRVIAYAISLKARLKIAEGKYDEAISAIQAGYAMGRHLGESSVLPHGLAGIAISAFMCTQVEQLVQEPDAPNVYWALKELPRPLVDLGYQMKMQLEEGRLRTKIEGLMDRLDRHVALLQCIEGLRHWAATHKGKFPGSLGEVTEVVIANDPVTDKPFVYSSSGREAVLKGPAPKGAEGEWAIDYRIRLKEKENENKRKMPKDGRKE